MSDQSGQDSDEIIFRHPYTKDGKRLWEITKSSGTLDLNSPYHYLIMCRHFKGTTVVAEYNGTIVGFVTAYIPPESENTFFVWQVAVDKSAQSKGVGKKMLVYALKHAGPKKPKFLEATITPSNAASIKLFSAVAKVLGASHEFNEVFFSEDDFGGDAHEAEKLFRIGPIEF